MGKKIAFLGNLSHKKGPMLLIEAFRSIYEMDSEHTLHIAGSLQDPRYAMFFDSIIPELNLQNNIHWAGHVDNVVGWLQDKDYIICTSPVEGSPVGLIEAMSVGLTPLIYAFAGSFDLFPRDFIWVSIPELLEKVKKGPQDPEIYRKFVKDHYNLEDQLNSISEIVDNLASKVSKRHLIPKSGTVGVVIAVKNGTKTVTKSLESLAESSIKPDKIVVVDDGSTDTTSDAVKTQKELLGLPIEIITLPINQWVFRARNAGAKMLDTDYLFFLDADDYVPANYIEETTKILNNNPDIGIVYPDMEYFDETNKKQYFAVPEFTPQGLVQHNFVAYASVQRLKIFNEAGGFSEYLNDTRNHLNEWDYWLRCLRKGVKFRRCAHTHLCYYSATTAVSDAQMSKGYERPRNDMHLQMAIGITDNLNSIKMGKGTKNILLVCQGKDYLDRNKLGFELMTWCAPLTSFGDVFTFQYDVEMAHFGREGMITRLMELVSLLEPVYIFHPAYKSDISPKTWSIISEDYNTICWFSDDNWRYDSFSKAYGEAFRYSVTTYPEIYDRMTHSGKILSQWGANVSYFFPGEKNIPVSFCGQNYGDRAEILNQIPNVLKCGKGWSSDSFLDFKDMASVLRRSKISINFSKGSQGKSQLKLRPFEICACNTLCFCEKVIGIEKYYEPGEEIVLFDSTQELKEAVEYYTKNDDKRNRIANAALDRTRAEHTWGHRLKAIFDHIERNK